jgi:hypothetical protein
MNMQLILYVASSPLLSQSSFRQDARLRRPWTSVGRHFQARRNCRQAYACRESTDKKPADVAVGATVDGVVSRTTSYGAFVFLVNQERTGLVHISELTNRYVSNVDELIQVGDTVQVKILGVDERGRLSLSLKQAELTGYARKVELGGDWGHPWNDDGQTRWADLGPRPCRTHYPWEPDPRLFTFNHTPFRSRPFDPTDVDG